MKQNIKMFLVLVLTGVMVACYEDKGSYDYVDINEIKVEGLKDKYEAVFKKDVLEIKPEITFTMDNGNPDRYAYEWEAMLYTDYNKSVVIGHERNLSYFMELLPGSYALYLKIRDKENGMLWVGESQLEVRTETGRGFLLIGEDEEGYANVDMIAMPKDTVVLRGLLDNNGLPRLKGPRNVWHTGAANGAYVPFIKLWVMTDDRSYYVNTSTFQGYETSTFERLVYSNIELPAELNPVWWYSKNNYPSCNASNVRIVICTDGTAFRAGLGTEEAYSNPLNRLSTEPDKLFKVYPCGFVSYSFFMGGGLYDMDNNRFVSFGRSGVMCTQLPDATGDIFPWKQPEGRVMKYAENGPESSYALMEDEATGNFHIYKFSISEIWTNKLGYYAIDKSLATDLDKAELFAFSSKQTKLFYAVDNVLHVYDYNPDNERHYTVPMDDTITMVKFDICSNWNPNSLFVATYNKQEHGILQRYQLEDNPNTLELTPDERCRWNGLVKVVNMDWRNSAD